VGAAQSIHTIVEPLETTFTGPLGPSSPFAHDNSRNMETRELMGSKRKASPGTDKLESRADFQWQGATPSRSEISHASYLTTSKGTNTV
jgi:hypothetical protein